MISIFSNSGKRTNVLEVTKFRLAMPFCSQCGNKVGDVDAYCARCGTAQPSAGPTPISVDPLASVSPRTLAVLCYIPIVGWIASVIVLGARRYRNDFNLRFHAFQGLYIFAAWLLVNWAIEPFFSSLPHHFFRLDHLLEFVLLGVWVFMLIKTSHGEAYSLPVFGELAQRSAQEHS
jgi:uncharacterized membrane protein